MTSQEFRDWRVAMGFTQQQAADELGISKSTVELYESGRRRDNKEPVVIPKVVELACVALRRVSRDDPSLEKAVREWHDAGKRRYEHFLEKAVDGDFVRENHLQFTYGIETANKDEVDPAKLVDVLRHVGDEVHDLVRTGWSMFYIFTRDGLRPYSMVDQSSGKGDKDFLECSLLEESQTGATDMWRVSCDGYATLLRSYFEDRTGVAETMRTDRGTFLSPNMLVQDVAEFVRHARALAGHLDKPKLISFRCEWRGLTDRHIGDPRAMWIGPERFDKGVDARASSGSWTPAQAEEKWPEIVAALTGPVARAAGIGQVITADWIKGQSARWRSYH